MTILLDPRLLAPPGRPSAPLSAAPEFWHRIVEWAADARARLGVESHQLVCEEYARHGYPDQDLNLEVPALKREYQAALGRLLSRVLAHSSDPEGRTFLPAYCGTEEQGIALQLDVSGTVGSGVLAIATAPEHWSDGASTLSIEPSPPASLSLCLVPGAQLVEERMDQLRVYYEGTRIHIVGGREEQAIVSAISETLGVAAKSVIWTPCEKARPPRDLDARWRRLTPSRDVTVCITGRVGHATSEKARDAAARAGVAYLTVELPSDVLDELVAHAARHGALDPQTP